LLAAGEDNPIVDAGNRPGVDFRSVVQATFGPREGLNLPVGYPLP